MKHLILFKREVSLNVKKRQTGADENHRKTQLYISDLFWAERMFHRLSSLLFQYRFSFRASCVLV